MEQRSRMTAICRVLSLKPLLWPWKHLKNGILRNLVWIGSLGEIIAQAAMYELQGARPLSFAAGTIDSEKLRLKRA